MACASDGRASGACRVPADRAMIAARALINELRGRGAEGVIAGCTEIELMVGPDDVTGRCSPAARVHALAAAAAAIG